MKILHIADLHLGKNLDGYDLIPLQREVLEQIEKQMETHDCCIISGDIYDRAVPSSEATSLFDDFLSNVINEQKKKIVMINGNHDSFERLTFGSKLFKSSGMWIATHLMDHFVIDGINFYAIPFNSLPTYRMALNIDFKSMNDVYQYLLKDINYQGTNILVLHDYVAGSNTILESDSERPLQMGGFIVTDASLFTKFDYVALGHIHGPQKVLQENIRYSGSIMKYSFSEALHHKTSVSFDTLTKTIHLLPLNQSKDLVEIEGFMEELLNKDWYQKYRVKNDFFKIHVLDKGTVYDCFNRLKGVYLNLMEVNRENSILSEQKKHIERTFLTKAERFEAFYKEMSEESLSKNQKELVDSLLNKETGM